MNERTDTQNSVRTSVAFWRNLTFVLLSFVAGNGVAFFSFGMNTASKEELAKAVQQESAQIEAVQQRQAAEDQHQVAIENALNELVGYLRGKRVINQSIDPLDARH